jgi:hypothetical protein
MRQMLAGQPGIDQGQPNTALSMLFYASNGSTCSVSVDMVPSTDVEFIGSTRDERK